MQATSDSGGDRLSASALRNVLIGWLLLLLPVAWFAAKYDRYNVDGDAVAYMDIADLLHTHQWSATVNAYWNPLYPAMLWLAQVLFHPSRMTELSAYYRMNFMLFLAQVMAMLCFVSAFVRLRRRMTSADEPLLSKDALRLIGLSLLVIAVGREMSLGKVRTDGLLQALILFGLSAMMAALAADGIAAGLGFAALMGLSFGLAYLTKSFAFLLTLLAVLTLVLFAARVQRRSAARAAGQGIVAFFVFSLVAAPYIAALSRQKHRFDFGDSGSLNYVWYVSGTEKMHLEPWMTSSFGSAKVHLIHPERQLLVDPGVYSYKALQHGTYPPWFDATYFNERIVARFSLRLLLRRDLRNVVLIVRYLLNHPEPLLLLAVLLACGTSLRGSHRYAWPVLGLGLAMWAIYTLVNVEERYVTVAYFAVLLPVFAALGSRNAAESKERQRLAVAVVLLFSLLTMGELVRATAENRRQESVAGPVPAWRDPEIFGAAEALQQIGIRPGDEIACIGTTACVYDHYWARLAGARILTEIYEPDNTHLMRKLEAMPYRDAAIATVRREGARVLVGSFDPGEMNATHPAAAGWVRLGETSFYALPLNGR